MMPPPWGGPRPVVLPHSPPLSNTIRVYFTHSGGPSGTTWHVCLPLLVQINFISAFVHFLQPNQSFFTCKYASSKCIAFIRVCLTKCIQISASHCFFHPNISYFICGSTFPNAPCGPNSYCVQEKYGYYR